MASTNKTTNYELSQFQSSDIPAWLTDYNGDMQKIDAGIHAAKVQAEGAASGVSALQTAVSGKQDRLTFDGAPISGSSNPVTSGGIYTALQSVSVQTDAVPTAGSTKAVQSGGVYTALQGKQNTLTFDSTPTQGSTNPVTSGGVYTALQNAGGGSAAKVNVTLSEAAANLHVVCFKVNGLYMLVITGSAKAATINGISVYIPEQISGAPSSMTELDGQTLVGNNLGTQQSGVISWRWDSSNTRTTVRLPVPNSDVFWYNQTIYLM